MESVHCCDFDTPPTLSEQHAAQNGQHLQPCPKPSRDPVYLQSIRTLDHASEQIAEEITAQTQSW
jgi:hypothetical protein